MSKPKSNAQNPPPMQPELKQTPIIEDEESPTAQNKKRANRKTLRAAYLTGPAGAGNGVTVAGVVRTSGGMIATVG